MIDNPNVRNEILPPVTAGERAGFELLRLRSNESGRRGVSKEGRNAAR
jgi:hypothetical protein